MIKKSLIFVTSMLILGSLFIVGPRVISSESNAKLSLLNQTSSDFQYIFCSDEIRVGDPSLPNSIKAKQQSEIYSKFLNSSDKLKVLDIYLIPGGLSENSSTTANFDKNCSNQPTVITKLRVNVSKNTTLAITITGETVSNGLKKSVSSLKIDNSAHPLTEITTQMQTKPTKPGIMVVDDSLEPKNICIDGAVVNVSLDRRFAPEYVGYIELNLGKHSLSPVGIIACGEVQKIDQEVIDIYEDQFVIVKETDALNQLYQESGVEMKIDIDKNNKDY
jgi:hypothetical protein